MEGGGNLITYNLRTPVETDTGSSVGVTGENKSFTARFLIKELTDKSLTFSIHLRFADGSVNTVVPDNVNVDDNATLIIWNIKKNDIFAHGFFEMQIEGRRSDGYIFQTEIVRMYADESIPVEDKEYENPNSETLKLREEAYEFLCELKLQQDKLDENMKLLLATDITNKADKAELKAGLKEKQNVKYIGVTVTNIDDFIALSQTDTVYTGRMQGFSTYFGEAADNVVKGFRMWFVLSGTDNYIWYRIIMFDDGTIWSAVYKSQNFHQLSYSKTQFDRLIGNKSDKTEVYTKSEVEDLINNAVSNIVTVLYLSDNEQALIAGKSLTYAYAYEELTLNNPNENLFLYNCETIIV